MNISTFPLLGAWRNTPWVAQVLGVGVPSCSPPALLATEAECWVCTSPMQPVRAGYDRRSDDRSLALAYEYAESSFRAFFGGTNLVSTICLTNPAKQEGNFTCSPTFSMFLCLCCTSENSMLTYFLCKRMRQMYAKSTWTNISKPLCWEKFQGDYKTWRL